MNRLADICKELEPLDRARVPGVGSQQNFAFLAALDKHWPTIRGMLSTQNAQKPKRSFLSRIFHRDDR